MQIKVGDTSLNTIAFKDWAYETFVSVYRHVLKEKTMDAWIQIQSCLKDNVNKVVTTVISDVQEDSKVSEPIKKRNRKRGNK